MSGLRSIGALVLIVRRSLRQHALSTSITVLSAALACGLVMAVFSVSQQSRRAFAGGPVGFDAVLGARGSQLQLVLNTVFHLETSPGNIPWSLYREIAADPRVELAIPYAVGDNYRNYRIVGTTPAIFSEFEYQEGRSFAIEPPGRPFDATLREAVLGSRVAEELGLRRGDEIYAYHGFEGDRDQHAGAYLVVGIMEPTNSPSDRVIWIPIEGVFRMGGHVLRGTEGVEYEPQPGVSIPDEHKEISAVMLVFRGNSYAIGNDLSYQINRQGKVATLAFPIGMVMAQLFDKLGWFAKVLELVAYLVVAVAAGSILASLYNTMNERRREFAILRALGARRSTVLSAIVLESTAIAALGSLVGYAVYFAILSFAAALIRRETGVVLDLWALHPALYWTPLAVTLLGALSGLAPAVKAYRTEVADNLLPTS